MSDETISIPLPTSESGKTIQRCPLESCEPAVFFLGDGGSKVALEWIGRTRRPPNTPGTTCPYCGHDGADEDFQDPDDKRYIDRAIDHELERYADQLFDRMVAPLERSFKKLERSTRGGMFQIKVTTTRKRGPIQPRPSLPDRQDLLRNVTCHICGRQYGVFALALFCPDCGCPNLTTHLRREREMIQADVRESSDLADRERAHRRLANAQGHLVTVTETYLKTLFSFVARKRLDENEAEKAIKKVGNAFQSIKRGKEQFEPFDFDPYGSLDITDAGFMDDMMSKRHVVAHNLGLADDKFITRTGQGKPGQNIELKAIDIIRFLDLMETVIGHCERNIPEMNGWV